MHERMWMDEHTRGCMRMDDDNDVYHERVDDDGVDGVDMRDENECARLNELIIDAIDWNR